MGLAIGDAVGTTLEFQQRDSYRPLDDMVGGGPFRLSAGEWTDDTSMALCLAETLETTGRPDGEIDPIDLMKRFVSWWRYGYNSCTGNCFDIGVTVSSALGRFEVTGNPYAGSTDPGTAGNGSIMRLAPVVLRYWNNPKAAQRAAYIQGITTHAADECVDACATLTHVIIQLALGKPPATALVDAPTPRNSKLWQLTSGVFIGKPRHEISSSGYVLDTLEAALWSLCQTDNPRDAILLAANLGGDADTVAAVAGQLAGAYWGLNSFPQNWLEKLAWHDRILEISTRLIHLSQEQNSS
jgi:ADP-ribosyl-[dinitrogen reductase] hydrolase